jgi:hypothetical protein
MVLPVIAFSALILFSISNANNFPKSIVKDLKIDDQVSGNADFDSMKSVSISYPDSIKKWKQQIESAAINFQLDPNLIAAVMLQESGGDPNAYSNSGAVGLMQVMPSDGIAAGFFCGDVPCFGNRPTSTELFDPEFNVDYGSRMLSGLIQKYGNARDALKAYGPMDMAFGYADIVLDIWTTHQ